MVAVAIIGSAVVGGVASGVAGGQAAGAQREAANQANATQTAMYNATRADLAPYNQLGKDALGDLAASARISGPETLQPFNPTQEWLENTPGYKFNLSQGLKGVQNSAAARGLGISGAALKGAAQYATGLADNTYQNQFNNYLSSQQQAYNQKVGNQQNTYNRLLGITQLGENAAAQTGAYGTQTAQGIADTTVGAGNASAAAMMNWGNQANNAASSIGSMYMLNALMKNGGGGGIF